MQYDALQVLTEILKEKYGNPNGMLNDNFDFVICDNHCMI